MYIIGGSNGEGAGDGKLYSSPDLTSGSFTAISTPIDGHIIPPFRAVAYNGTRWVAGGIWTGNLGGILYNRMIYSDDGVVWNISTTPLDSMSAGWQLRDALWVSALGLFVLACSNVSNHATFLTSPDGLTWTERTAPTASAPRHIYWGNNLLICGTETDGQYLTSLDGITWTVRSSGVFNSFMDVIWVPSLSLWVLTGFGPPFGFRQFFTSPDAITWTERASSFQATGFAIESNGSLIVCVGYSSGANIWGLQTSTNGTSWTLRTTPLSGLIGSYDGKVLWTGSKWVVGVCPRVGNPGIITSTDGITWSAVTMTPFIEAARIVFGAIGAPMKQRIGIPIK